VSAVLPILLLGVAGMFIGGAISVRRQGGSLVPVTVLGLLGALAAAGGVLWMIDS
jgi:hypothetical protein